MFRLSVPEPQKLVGANFDKVLLSSVNSKSRGVKEAAFTVTQKIKTELMQTKPFHFS